jgi:hypothetical protein
LLSILTGGGAQFQVQVEYRSRFVSRNAFGIPARSVMATAHSDPVEKLANRHRLCGFGSITPSFLRHQIEISIHVEKAITVSHGWKTNLSELLLFTMLLMLVSLNQLVVTDPLKEKSESWLSCSFWHHISTSLFSI